MGTDTDSTNVSSPFSAVRSSFFRACVACLVISPPAQMECFWTLGSLALLLTLAAVRGRASEHERPGWKPNGYTGVHARATECVDIPEDLRLCHEVGYSQMLLPNLLGHESMAEVRLQASGWVPLVLNGCHPGTQALLCSLFAPVCLERAMPPCRWLCEAVRDGCSPVMEAFGFGWPDMLACDVFPQDDFCIVNTTQSAFSGSSPLCPSCDTDPKMEVILEHLCASDFALKGRIAEVTEVTGDLSERQVVLEKRRRLLKGALRKKELRKLVLLLRGAAPDCPCPALESPALESPPLESPGVAYLITGRTADGRHLLTGIHRWDRTSADFRRAMRAYRGHRCPVLHTVFK